MFFDAGIRMFGNPPNDVSVGFDVTTVRTVENSGFGWDYKDTWVSKIGISWAVAASVVRSGSVDEPLYQLQVLFLPDDPNLFVTLGQPSPAYYFISTPNPIGNVFPELAHPRIAAIALDQNENDESLIEVTVVYEIRNVPNDYGEDWDIGFWRGEFMLDEEEPEVWEMSGFGFWDRFTLDGEQITPDLTYDYGSGDLHVVYTESESLIFADCIWTVWDRVAEDWEDAEPFSKDDNNAYSGWTPRIDIGYVYPLGSLNYDDAIVGVVYTAQHLGTTPWYGFRPYANFWLVDSGIPDQDNAFNISNPDFEPNGDLNPTEYWLHSGLPTLSISPHVPQSSNDHNEAVVAYVQNIHGSPWMLSRHEVWAITNGLYAPKGYTWIQIGGADVYDGGPAIFSAVLPSVECHHYDSNDPNGTGLDASISYLRIPAAAYPWQLDARRFYYDPDLQGSPIAGPITTIPGSAINGNFDYFDVNFHNFGASSAITSMSSTDPATETEVELYWALWSDTIGVYGEPNVVNGAFGYSDAFDFD